MEEKRLIDANAFLKDMLTAGIGKTIVEYSESDIAYMIRKRPTVDAVEVVRCRDCKFGMHFGDPEDEWINCMNLHGKPLMPFDGFCSYGERMDGDGYGNCLVHHGADLRGDPDGGGIVHHCQR